MDQPFLIGPPPSAQRIQAFDWILHTRGPSHLGIRAHSMTFPMASSWFFGAFLYLVI